jgi:hypothetical protein
MWKATSSKNGLGNKRCFTFSPPFINHQNGQAKKGITRPFSVDCCFAIEHFCVKFKFQLCSSSSFEVRRRRRTSEKKIEFQTN